jgi:hypothetical protein
MIGSPVGLREASEAFGNLQDLRNDADYDHAFDIDHGVALSAVDEARLALTALKRLSQKRDAYYLRFLRLAGGSVKIAKSR